MNTTVRTNHGPVIVPMEARMLSKRRIFIEGEITSETAGSFTKQLMLLADEDPELPVDIYINSPGGNVTDAGIVMYDLIKGAGKTMELRLHCIGMAGSMAAILLAAGKKNCRYILRNSCVMIHQPQMAASAGGSAAELQRAAENLKKTTERTVQLLAADTGRTPEQIEAAIAYDNYMDAAQAIAFGLCDKIETSVICEKEVLYG